ncbi:hypothetical protein SaSA85_1466 [Streptococcus agalactiae]|nr:hypothetical protein SaSA85_1466 [Streptococcus agalactiae]
MLLIDVMIHLSEENEKGFTKLQFFTRQIVVGVTGMYFPKLITTSTPKKMRKILLKIDCTLGKSRIKE